METNTKNTENVAVDRNTQTREERIAEIRAMGATSDEIAATIVDQLTTITELIQTDYAGAFKRFEGAGRRSGLPVDESVTAHEVLIELFKGNPVVLQVDGPDNVTIAVVDPNGPEDPATVLRGILEEMDSDDEEEDGGPTSTEEIKALAVEMADKIKAASSSLGTVIASALSGINVALSQVQTQNGGKDEMGLKEQSEDLLELSRRIGLIEKLGASTHEASILVRQFELLMRTIDAPFEVLVDTINSRRRQFGGTFAETIAIQNLILLHDLGPEGVVQIEDTPENAAIIDAAHRLNDQIMNAVLSKSSPSNSRTH